MHKAYYSGHNSDKRDEPVWRVEVWLCTCMQGMTYCLRLESRRNLQFQASCFHVQLLNITQRAHFDLPHPFSVQKNQFPNCSLAAERIAPYVPLNASTTPPTCLLHRWTIVSTPQHLILSLPTHATPDAALEVDAKATQQQIRDAYKK